MKRIASIVGILSLLLSCTSVPKEEPKTYDAESVRQSIEQVYQRVKQGILDRDVDAVASMYAEDAVLYRGDGSEVRGLQSLRPMLAGMIEQGVVLDCQPREVEMLGEYALEIGLCSAQDREGVESGRVKYLMLWKNEGGEWKAYRDFVGGGSS